jgi:hypothetical protein
MRFTVPSHHFYRQRISKRFYFKEQELVTEKRKWDDIKKGLQERSQDHEAFSAVSWSLSLDITQMSINLVIF